VVFLSYAELKSKKGIRYTREHINRLEKAGRFPRHVVHARDAAGNPKTISWVEDEIDAYQAELVAQRDAGE
jgi:prophage regulatory protein